MKLLREYIRALLKEDALGFVHTLANVELGPHDGRTDRISKESGRELKRAFNANADHQWLATLDTVHWAHVHNLLQLVGQNKDELSTTMTLPGESLIPAQLGSRETGLWVRGRITIAANDHDDMYTGTQGWYVADPRSDASKKEFEQRKRSSGINKRPSVSKDYSRYGMLKKGQHEEFAGKSIPYVLDQSTWDPSKNRSGVNEALVDNWKPIGIIAADDKVVDAVRYITAEQENPWEETIGVVKTTFEVIGIPVEESGGTKVTLGAVASAVVKVAEVAIIAFPDASSRVAPRAR